MPPTGQPGKIGQWRGDSELIVIKRFYESATINASNFFMRLLLAFVLLIGCSTMRLYAQCNHEDYFSGWERIKAYNSAGVTSPLDYVMYRVKRCTCLRPDNNRLSSYVCHPIAHVQVKAPDGMPADPKSGEVSAGYLIIEFASLAEPVEVLFTVRGPGDVYDNDAVSIPYNNIRSIKMLLMDDVLARLGKGNPVVRSGTAEKAIEFPGTKESSKTPAGNPQVSSPTPSILFMEQRSQPTASNTVAALSKKMPDLDDFTVEKTNETAAPTRPKGVAEFLKQGLWSDTRNQVDTNVYHLVPLDDYGNFLLIDKARIKSEETDTDRMRHFYPGISYPVKLLRSRRSDIKIRSRTAVLGDRG